MIAHRILKPERAATLPREVATDTLRLWLDWHGYHEAAREARRFARRNPWPALLACLALDQRVGPAR